MFPRKIQNRNRFVPYNAFEVFFNKYKTGNIRINVTERRVPRNHCCPGKAVSITYSACVRVCGLSYPACKAHAPYYTVSWDLSPHYIINGTIVGVGGKLMNIKCVFWFSLQPFFWNISHLNRIQRDVIINVHRASRKVPVILARF